MLVVGWYLVATTGVTFHVARPTKTVAVPNFPCATHACDCRTLEQCAESCCCFPVEVAMDPACPMHAEQATPPQSITVRVVAFAVAHCAGGDDGTTAPATHIGWHEPRFAATLTESHTEARWISTDARVPSSPDRDGPDKVPISLA